MTHKNSIRATAAALTAVIATLGLAPTVALAQGNRQKTKNDWRNLAIAAGGVAAYGLLRHDNTVSFLGAAGALYSLNRYEQDRKSQSQASRARAAFFDRGYFERDGHRYDRKVVTKNGKKYYQFVRRK